MVRLHEGIGTLVVVAFLAMTVVYVLQLRGKRIEWSRQLSMGAGGLLLVQYALGFILIGGDNDVSPIHYLFALGAIATVGLEHAMANGDNGGSPNLRLAAAAAAGTTTLALIAYAIGQSTA